MKADSLFSKHKGFYLFVWIISLISSIFLVLGVFLPLGYYNMTKLNFTKESFTIFKIADFSGKNLPFILFLGLFFLPTLGAEAYILSSIRENNWNENLKKITIFCVIAYICTIFGFIGYKTNLKLIETSTQYPFDEIETPLKFSIGSYFLCISVGLSIITSVLLLTILYTIKKSDKSEDEVMTELFSALPWSKKKEPIKDNSAENLEEKLEELNRLKEKGLLTEEEFNVKKSDTLNSYK